MNEYTTYELYEELGRRMNFDANVSEELAEESNKLQEKINSIKNYAENNKTNTTQTLDFDTGASYNNAILHILKIIGEDDG